MVALHSRDILGPAGRRQHGRVEGARIILMKCKICNRDNEAQNSSS